MKYKNVSLILLLSVFAVITGAVYLKKYESETLIDAKWNEKEDSLLAITIEGEEANSFPSNSSYEAIVTCTSGSGTASWNGSKWVFNVTGINQNKTKCNIDFVKTKILKDVILGDNTQNPITTPGAEISADTEAVLASTQDDYGTSYYYRGAVENNYVEYANMCWRIVRITGNGAIKLVLYNYNGLTDSNTTPSSSTPCSVTGDDLAFARYSGTSSASTYNPASEDNAFIGLMYGSSIGCSTGTATSQLKCTNAGGTWKKSTSYAVAQANGKKNQLLQNLETWYTNVLSKQSNFNESDLADTILCNDKKTVSDTTFTPMGWTISSARGYSTNYTYYSATQRLIKADKSPNSGVSLVCQSDDNGGKLSKLTVSDTTNGNGALDKKIGLLTADEIAFAGAAYNLQNTSYYLYQNAIVNLWWTSSPALQSVYSVLWVSGETNSLGTYSVTRTDGYVRPTISLVSDKKIISGDGTATKPYKIATS